MKRYRIPLLLLPPLAAIVLALALSLLALRTGAAGGTPSPSAGVAEGIVSRKVPAPLGAGTADALGPASCRARGSALPGCGEAGSLVPAGETPHVSRTAVGEAGSLVPAAGYPLPAPDVRAVFTATR